jgi:hypothetical protein
MLVRHRVSGSSHEHPLHWVVLTLEFKRGGASSDAAPTQQAGPPGGFTATAAGRSSTEAAGLQLDPLDSAQVHGEMGPGAATAPASLHLSPGAGLSPTEGVTAEELHDLEDQLNAAARALYRLNRQQQYTRVTQTSGAAGHTGSTTNRSGSNNFSRSTAAIAESARAIQPAYLRVDKVLTAPAGEGAGPAAVSVLCEVVPHKLHPPETAAGKE